MNPIRRFDLSRQSKLLTPILGLSGLECIPVTRRELKKGILPIKIRIDCAVTKDGPDDYNFNKKMLREALSALRSLIEYFITLYHEKRHIHHFEKYVELVVIPYTYLGIARKRGDENNMKRFCVFTERLLIKRSNANMYIRNAKIVKYIK